MTAGENQSEPVILDVVVVCRYRIGRFDPVDHGAIDFLESRCAAQTVDCLEPPGRYQPRTRVPRNSLGFPPFHRRGKSVMEGLLGEIEIVEEADEGREHTARL